MMHYLTHEIGIDGMLVAPGYQYSQIDPNLTMTREEHEEKFRAIRAAARKNNYRWLASPIYQDFLAGDRKLACAPWGSITRNPYGWKGPCYLLDRRDLPDLRGAAGRDRVGGVRARQRRSLRALRDPLRLRAVRRVRGDEEPARHRSQHRMDADRLTLACATTAELRAARRAGRRSALVGLGAANGVPDGPLVSFGLAGALRDDLPVGTVLDATRVVAADGAVLWEGEALRRPRRAAGDDPRRRAGSSTPPRSGAARTRRRGADAADLESGPLARTGRLQGVLRVVSDTPERPLGPLAGAVRPDGRNDWLGVARGVVRSPRAAVNAARAVGKLGAAAKGWSA